jgi:hypothetical protein
MLRLIIRIHGFAPLKYRHFLDRAVKQVFLYN